MSCKSMKGLAFSQPHRMTKKVYPSLNPNPTTTNKTNNNLKLEPSNNIKEGFESLTVWKKSLVLNCNGFTVFDGSGNLVFRVDNYVAANRGEIVLMDASGKSLLTIRRKRLSWGDNWLIYDGESSVNPKYLVRKQSNLLTNSKTMMSLAIVLSANKKDDNCTNSILYQIEGSYAQRSVLVYNQNKRCVAEIKRKEATCGVTLGGDVFRLMVRPHEIDRALAMALVILLDQMFGSS